MKDVEEQKPNCKYRDYGWLGRIGIGTPQANPTVEAEIRRLIPRGVEYFTLRLTSSSDNPSERLKEYLLQLPNFVKTRFAGLQIDAFLYGCTASSYLVDPSIEADILAEASGELNGAPIVPAAHALNAWLQNIDAKSIAIATPYPDWLHAPAESYWQRCGYDVVSKQQIELSSEDTSNIYFLQSTDARPALEKLAKAGADAIVISGTGMPSLSLLAAAQDIDIKVISSNYAMTIDGLAYLKQTPTEPDEWALNI